MIDIEEIVDSFHPINEKVRDFIDSQLRAINISERNGRREIRVRDGMPIPFREHLYVPRIFDSAVCLKEYCRDWGKEASLILDSFGQRWLIFRSCAGEYKDDFRLLLPVFSEYEADRLYEKEEGKVEKYFWESYKKAMVPHIRVMFNPYDSFPGYANVYLATDDRSFTKEEVFWQIVNNYDFRIE